MLSSIHPLGERGRNNRYAVTVVAYMAGSVAGGVAAGSLFGGLGQVLAGIRAPTARTVAGLVLAVAVVGVALDLRVGGLRVPTNHRQVNEDWLTRYRGWVYGLGFGFQLGLGFVTIVPTAGIYAMFILAVVSGSLWTGMAIGLTFGLVRSVMILMNFDAHTPQALRASHRRLAAAGDVVRHTAVVAQGGLAVMMMGVLIWL